MNLFVLLVVGLLGWHSAAVAAELTVLVDGPARPAILSIADGFKRSSGHGLAFVFGPGPALNKRVLQGERADVVITPRRYLDELQAQSRADAAHARSIGGAGFALAVRKGGTTFDVSTVDALKASLLKADPVVFNNVGSGNYFATVLERLSLSEAIAGKVVRSGPIEVFDRVARSSAAEIVVGTTPLVLEDERLQMLGELPPELQSRLELFAVPLTGSTSRDLAEAFVAYLVSPAAKERLAASGLR